VFGRVGGFDDGALLHHEAKLMMPELLFDGIKEQGSQLVQLRQIPEGSSSW
jgi:hypothetical protein